MRSSSYSWPSRVLVRVPKHGDTQTWLFYLSPFSSYVLSSSFSIYLTDHGLVTTDRAFLFFNISMPDLPMIQAGP